MPKLYFSREEMERLNIEKLNERGVSVEEIALVAYNQQLKYNPTVSMEECIISVKKILSLKSFLSLLNGLSPNECFLLKSFLSIY